MPVKHFTLLFFSVFFGFFLFILFLSRSIDWSQAIVLREHSELCCVCDAHCKIHSSDFTFQLTCVLRFCIHSCIHTSTSTFIHLMMIAFWTKLRFLKLHFNQYAILRVTSDLLRSNSEFNEFKWVFDFLIKYLVPKILLVCGWQMFKFCKSENWKKNVLLLLAHEEQRA